MLISKYKCDLTRMYMVQKMHREKGNEKRQAVRIHPIWQHRVRNGRQLDSLTKNYFFIQRVCDSPLAPVVIRPPTICK